MMWNIRKIIHKGDYEYALVPEHPNATKNGYVLMHRIVMENHLGRLLSDKEIVHHIDHNRKNNDISNLEVMGYKEHVKMHADERLRKMVMLKCPWCEKEFTLPSNESFLGKPRYKYRCTCCSRSCGGKLKRHIQLNGITPDIQRRMDECLIKEYDGKL